MSTQSTTAKATTGVATLLDENGVLWRIKLRLQFTGWLQYMPPLLAGVGLLFVAGLLALLGALHLASAVFAMLGWLLLADFAFEVVTTRLGVRPTEAVPPPPTSLDAFDLMRNRRSCRSFQARGLTPEHKEAVLASVQAHTRPDRLLGTSPIRFEYVAAPLTVWPAVGAHEFLVAIAPSTYDRTAVIDVGRSLQQVVIDATRVGVATCWIGPGADHASIERHLGARLDPARDHIICVCALGYRSRIVPFMIRIMSRTMSTRLPLEALFFSDPGLRTPLDVAAAPFADFGRCYEACQWSPSSYNGQTTRCVVVAEGGRARRFDFYAATSSRYYAPVALGIWLADWELGCAALGQAGHFEVLSPEARGAVGAPEVPRYDASWVVRVLEVGPLLEQHDVVALDAKAVTELAPRVRGNASLAERAEQPAHLRALDVVQGHRDRIRASELVAGSLHRDLLGYSRPHQKANRTGAQVVQQLAGDAGCGSTHRPCDRGITLTAPSCAPYTSA